jgi:hypothetical protein
LYNGDNDDGKSNNVTILFIDGNHVLPSNLTEIYILSPNIQKKAFV